MAMPARKQQGAEASRPGWGCHHVAASPASFSLGHFVKRSRSPCLASVFFQLWFEHHWIPNESPKPSIKRLKSFRSTDAPEAA